MAHTTKPQRSFWKWAIALAMALLLGYGFLIEPGWVVVTSLQKQVGLKGATFKLAQLSDLHLSGMGAVDALKDAIAAQGHTTGVKWVAGLSSSVRPVITYWFMALYCAAKSASFASAVTAGTGWDVAILHAWTEADQALWAGVLNFWFLGRVFDRVRP